MKILQQSKLIFNGDYSNIGVISDFDGTLTRFLKDDGISNTVLAQIAISNVLGDTYNTNVNKLYQYYNNIELNNFLSNDEKNRCMTARRLEHVKLLQSFNVNSQVIEQIVSHASLYFRKNVIPFLEFLEQNNIPLIIVSGGCTELIHAYLYKEGLSLNNVIIVSNSIYANSNGVVNNYNKKDVLLKKYLSHQSNIILLGDTKYDSYMGSDLENLNILSIGFNNTKESNISEYFDIIVNDDFDYEMLLNILLVY